MADDKLPEPGPEETALTVRDCDILDVLEVPKSEREHVSEHAVVETPEPDARKCRAHTSGLHGTKRPCRNWAIKGGTVCPYHGGKAPQVKAAAQRRLQAMLDPALVELNDLIHQNDHLPSKLGAISNVMNRTLGKVGETKDKGQKGLVINVGIGLGGLPPQKVLVHVERPEDEDEIPDGELRDTDNEDKD